MKKYSILVAAAIASLTAFTSCDDMNECGCECSVPVITNVEKLDEAGVSIAGSVEAGSYVAIMGSNLGNVTAIRFGDRTVSIKPAYRSENTLIVQVPSVTKSCIGTLITNNCPEGYPNQALSIVIGTPTVYMMYNEFVADGDWLKLKGSSFVGDQMCVDFVMSDGTSATVSGADIKLIGNNGDEMHVKVPAGAAFSQNFVVRNAAENKASVCPIMFRDYRNVLTDFDAITNYMFGSGAIEKDAEGIYSLAYGDEKTAWTSTVPANYSPTGVNNFGVFNNADGWQNISFVPGALTADNPTVFGPNFLPLIQADPASVNNYVVKFEMYVPKEFPTNYLVYTLGFSAANDDGCGESRAFCAGVQQSAITWNKDNPETGWEYEKASDFSTDGWMTVTVPMSEFMWNFQLKNYPAFAQNISEGDWGNADLQAAFGDSDNHTNYAQANQEAFGNSRKEKSKWGSLIMQINPYDGPKNAEAINKAAHIAIDNLRVVPNDGNGAIYPKTAFGKPSQHYYDNPRIKAF